MFQRTKAGPGMTLPFLLPIPTGERATGEIWDVCKIFWG
jgi:hypothetical protein